MDFKSVNVFKEFSVPVNYKLRHGFLLLGVCEVVLNTSVTITRETRTGHIQASSRDCHKMNSCHWISQLPIVLKHTQSFPVSV